MESEWIRDPVLGDPETPRTDAQLGEERSAAVARLGSEPEGGFTCDFRGC